VSGAGAMIAAAVPFVWLGMVLAISGLEAPLKFRAPGITVPLGLGIGRLVFRGLNACEVALAGLLAAAGAATGMPAVGWLLFAGLVGLLAVQVALLRPRLDRRAVAIVAGQTLSPSRQHLVYIGLEGVKVLTLLVLGAVLIGSGMP